MIAAKVFVKIYKNQSSSQKKLSRFSNFKNERGKPSRLRRRRRKQFVKIRRMHADEII